MLTPLTLTWKASWGQCGSRLVLYFPICIQFTSLTIPKPLRRFSTGETCQGSWGGTPGWALWVGGHWPQSLQSTSLAVADPLTSYQNPWYGTIPRPWVSRISRHTQIEVLVHKTCLLYYREASLFISSFFFPELIKTDLVQFCNKVWSVEVVHCRARWDLPWDPEIKKRPSSPGPIIILLKSVPSQQMADPLLQNFFIQDWGGSTEAW